MARIKALIASIMCGLSTFTVVPSTNYADFVLQSPNAIAKAAWNRTGKSLRNSIGKVGKSIGAVESSEQRRQIS